MKIVFRAIFCPLFIIPLIGFIGTVFFTWLLTDRTWKQAWHDVVNEPDGGGIMG